MESAYIGSDVLFHIVSWMPAKSAIKNLPLVSRTLIYEPEFLHKQSMNSSHFDGGFFLQTDNYTDLEFLVLPTESPTDFGIPKDSLSFLKNNARVLASSNGLILIRSPNSLDGNRFSICNPVTKTFAPIPHPEHFETLHRIDGTSFVLTCDPMNHNNFPDDFILVAPVFFEVDDGAWNMNYRLAIYRNSRWDDDTCDLRVPPCHRLRLESPVGVCVKGQGLVVHYLCDSLPRRDREPLYLKLYVLAYDMEIRRLWKAIELPEGGWVEDGDHMKLRIVKWGKEESVGIMRVDFRRVVVWKLEGYGEGGWRKVVELSVSDIGVEEEEGNVVGCTIVNGGELLFATWKRVYLYEMEGGNGGRLKAVGSHRHSEMEAGFRKLEFTLYANTLRPVCGQRTITGLFKILGVSLLVKLVDDEVMGSLY